MKITNDIRTYADSAVNQGKHALDNAQAQLNDVTGQANEFVGKARENVTGIATKANQAVTDLRASAEKAINLEAIKTAVEPYLVQAKEYQAQVTDRAEVLFSGIKNDKRVAALVEQVQDRVVKPAQSLTRRGTKPAAKKPAPTAKPAPASDTKPAATKPATTKPARKPAARKAPAKRTTKA